jgi:predicted outer membrane repeat protein
LIIEGRGHFVHGERATQCLKITSLSTVTLMNVTVSGCCAAGPGGAIYLEDSEIRMRTCEFTDNSSTEDGGAVWAQNGQLSAFKCTFLRNDARDGGAVYAIDTKVGFTLCEFGSNAPNDVTNL